MLGVIGNNFPFAELDHVASVPYLDDGHQQITRTASEALDEVNLRWDTICRGGCIKHNMVIQSRRTAALLQAVKTRRKKTFGM
eukprot:4645751-Amphidinium_carterae.1